MGCCHYSTTAALLPRRSTFVHCPETVPILHKVYRYHERITVALLPCRSVTTDVYESTTVALLLPCRSVTTNQHWYDSITVALLPCRSASCCICIKGFAYKQAPILYTVDRWYESTSVPLLPCRSVVTNIGT
eukprot:TRINITY_DN2744_c0_g1_i2.p1 TRINITY_DN2744_c0_g1~~TRINITY_DN2744_c0_g1_i2.p1  ORF type:complete len:132 (-),score=9.49 TRINITY_DN2744_c0_g1_i2:41-436(-)